jgi:hypothetical protein
VSDELVDAHGLAGMVVDEVHLRQPQQDRSAVARLDFVLMLLPTTCSGGMPYAFSVQGLMKSIPPPETMKVLKPLSRRKASNSSMGWYTRSVKGLLNLGCLAVAIQSLTLFENSSVVIPA